jgi:hypothetical protein
VLASTSGSGTRTLVEQLVAGTYHLRIEPQFSGDCAAYTLTLTPTPISMTDPNDPGPSISTARDLGTITALVSQQDLVGGLDQGDVYTFTLTQPRQIQAQLDGMDEGVNFWLYVDTDGDLQFDGNEVLESTFGSGTRTLVEQLVAGTYHLRIEPQFSGDCAAYTLTITPSSIPITNPADPGTTIATARNLGAITALVTQQDLVGGIDQGDVYTFTLDQPRQIQAQLTGMDEGVNFWLYVDVDGDGQFDGNEVLESTFGSGTRTLVEQLVAGTYHLRIEPQFSGESTAYTLTITPSAITITDPADPGTTIATARNLGTVSSLITQNDLVGGIDQGDVYTFALGQSRQIQAQLTGMDEGVNFWLYVDLDGDGQFDGNEVLESTFGSGTRTLVEQLAAGTYHLRIEPQSSGDSTAYTLTITPSAVTITDPADPGTTIATARNLGTVSSLITQNDLVGGIDQGDVFTFTLTQPRQIEAQLTGLDEGVDFRLYSDTDGDGQFDGNEVLESTFGSGTRTLLADLLPGVYHLRITPDSSGTSTAYTLTITPV